MGVRNTQWIIQIVPWLGMFAGAIMGAVLVREAGISLYGAIACRPVAYCRSVPDTPPLAK